ncbi:fungal specific transcription factor domain-containing protein [Sarocladium implicatum]|nr:fungal specific transcription factor domain-containing protein [Sarocladium implicatum]
MNQAEIMRLLYRSNQGHALESDEQALFAAIITYATIQTSTSLAAEENEQGCSKQTTSRDALALHHKVDRLLPGHGEAGSIANVQAMLILTMINIGRGDWQDAWGMIGRATRLATYLKLSSPSSLPLQPPSASSAYGASRRSHTLLACFVLETVLSTRLALPPHLRTEDLNPVETVDCSGMDEWEPWSGAVKASSEATMHHGPSFSASTFNGLVDAAKLLQSTRTAQSALSSSMESWQDLWNHFTNARKRIEEQLDNSLGGSAAGDSMLPHQIFLRFTLETALSTLYCCYPGRLSQDLKVEDVLSLTDRIGGLLEKQTRIFSPTTVYPVYLPLMETTFNNITSLQRDTGSSERLQAAISEVKQMAQPLAEVWIEITSDDVMVQEPRATAREAHARSMNQDLTLAFPQRDSAAKPPHHLSRASYGRTDHIPPKVNSSSPSLGHFITGGSTELRDLSSVVPIPTAIGQMQTPGLPEWSRRDPDTSLFTEPVSVAPATAAENLEDTYSHAASSLGDRDFESAFHEMLTSDADSWSQSWSQSLMNLGFCNTESMRHISGDMFMTNDRPPP